MNLNITHQVQVNKATRNHIWFEQISQRQTRKVQLMNKYEHSVQYAHTYSSIVSIVCSILAPGIRKDKQPCQFKCQSKPLSNGTICMWFLEVEMIKQLTTYNSNVTQKLIPKLLINVWGQVIMVLYDKDAELFSYLIDVKIHKTEFDCRT